MQNELNRSVREAESENLENEVQSIAHKMQVIKESSARTDDMQDGVLKTKRLAHIQENRRGEKEARHRNEFFHWTQTKLRETITFRPTTIRRILSLP